MNMDPLAETSRRVSPYVFALNNPIYFVDPDGMDEEDHWVARANNSVYWDDEALDPTTTKPGETYLGTSVLYEPIGNKDYNVQLNSDKTWKYVAAHDEDRTVVSDASSTQSSNSVNQFLGDLPIEFLDDVNSTAEVFSNFTEKIPDENFSNWGKELKRITGPVGHTVDASKIGYGIYKDNGTFGRSAQRETGKIVGGLVGTEMGAIIGGTIGFAFGSFFTGGIGGVPFYSIGAAFGTAIGAYWGNSQGSGLGESVVKIIQE